MQVRFIWHPDAPHADDWAYGIVTSTCPKGDSPIAVIEADVWNPGFAAESLDNRLVRPWLEQVAADGLSLHAL
jgi:hypothetical protein